MTGAMRKMGVYLGLVEEEVHDDVDSRVNRDRGRSYDRDEPVAADRAIAEEAYDYDDEEPPARPVTRVSEPEPVIERRVAPERFEAPQEPAPREVPAPAPQRITTLHPRTYAEARTLGEQFRDGNPVIMNLTEMEDADAKRIVDFAAGLTFALRGSFERITAKVFLLSPQKVKVTAEDKARIADGRYPARG